MTENGRVALVSGILVNSVEPGRVQTEMGGSRAPRPVEEGGDAPQQRRLLPRPAPDPLVAVVVREAPKVCGRALR